MGGELSSLLRETGWRLLMWLRLIFVFGGDGEAAYLAYAVWQTDSDSDRVEVLGNLLHTAEGRLSAAGVSRILAHFKGDSYKVDALKLLAPHIAGPMATESKVDILRHISGPSYKADASEILAPL